MEISEKEKLSEKTAQNTVPNTEKVTRKVAELEVTKWLDHKKVKDRKRENLQDQIDIMVGAIIDGSLVLDQDCKFTHQLSFPIENAKGEVTVRSLTYKPRLSVIEINAKMKGVKPTDADARVVGYISALTGQPSAVLTSLDTEDNSLAQAFATFFL